MKYIDLVPWDDIRDTVVKSAPQLAEIMDDINPNERLPLYKVTYPYGSTILDFKTGFHLPTDDGDLVPLSDSRIPKSIRDDLSYQSIPFGIILKNSIEIYREVNKKVSPVCIFNNMNAGLELGVWEYFDWQTPYSVSAGTRSVYMVPRISLAHEHIKLKRNFSKLTNSAPRQLFDHWQVFREIATSPEFKQPWFCEIIYLGKKWHQTLGKQSPKWTKLKAYVLEKAWQHSGFGRKRILFDFLWESLAYEMNNRGLKPSTYATDTLKHILSLSLGELSAHAPFIGDQTYGPFAEIQRIYTDIYNLKEYIPTIMCPKAFDLNINTPVYYSLQTPTLLAATPGIKTGVSNIEYMRELLDIIRFIRLICVNDLTINNIRLSQHLQQISFDFFHSDSYVNDKTIKSTLLMPAEDPNLLYSSIKNDQRKFCDQGGFIRGCIRIMKK